MSQNTSCDSEIARCVQISYLSCTTITDQDELEGRWCLSSFRHSAGVCNRDVGEMCDEFGVQDELEADCAQGWRRLVLLDGGRIVGRREVVILKCWRRLHHSQLQMMAGGKVNNILGTG